jgi:hypothetical protein
MVQSQQRLEALIGVAFRDLGRGKDGLERWGGASLAAQPADAL